MIQTLATSMLESPTKSQTSLLITAFIMSKPLLRTLKTVQKKQYYS